MNIKKFLSMLKRKFFGPSKEFMMLADVVNFLNNQINNTSEQHEKLKKEFEEFVKSYNENSTKL